MMPHPIAARRYTCMHAIPTIQPSAALSSGAHLDALQLHPAAHVPQCERGEGGGVGQDEQTPVQHGVRDAQPRPRRWRPLEAACTASPRSTHAGCYRLLPTCAGHSGGRRYDNQTKGPEPLGVALGELPAA